MFLSTYILICKQILCPKTNRTWAEESFDEEFPKLEYTKKIYYNIKPFYKFTQKMIKITKPKNEYFIIINLLKTLDKDNTKYRKSINFDDFKKTTRKIKAKLDYNLNNVGFNFYEKIFEEELNIFKVFLALDTLPKYDQDNEELVYKYERIDDFFLSLVEFTSAFISSGVTAEHPISNNPPLILLIKWWRSHSTKYIEALEKKGKIYKTSSIL
ncbi:hypothetical protein CDIK_1238 [Cucumispora dikerogammari]|nr:hypothetical protein CDIK_1238 [Cucumispora dikerogammari]